MKAIFLLVLLQLSTVVNGKLSYQDLEMQVEKLEKKDIENEQRLKRLSSLDSTVDILNEEITRLQNELNLHKKYLKTNGGMHDEINELIEEERKRQNKILHEDADSVENGPKEIFIYCKENPQIQITDLSETERDQDECLVLTMKSPEFSSRLVLYCDGKRNVSYDEI